MPKELTELLGITTKSTLANCVKQIVAGGVFRGPGVVMSQPKGPVKDCSKE